MSIPARPRLAAHDHGAAQEGLPRRQDPAPARSTASRSRIRAAPIAQAAVEQVPHGPLQRHAVAPRPGRHFLGDAGCFASISRSARGSSDGLTSFPVPAPQRAFFIAVPRPSTGTPRSSALGPEMRRDAARNQWPAAARQSRASHQHASTACPRRVLMTPECSIVAALSPDIVPRCRRAAGASRSSSSVEHHRRARGHNTRNGDAEPGSWPEGHHLPRHRWRSGHLDQPRPP